VRVVTALADVADAAACEAMVARGLAELGAVDVLVCNAAIRPHKSITDTSVEEWHRVLGVNLHAAFYLSRAVVPAMKARRRGSIIALGGMSSLTGRPNTAAVVVAKTGLLGLIRALAAELGPFGIRANMVMPGSSTPSGATPSGIRSSASRRRARPTSSRRFRYAGSGGPRTSPTPACSWRPTRRLRDRRRHPRDGRPRHRLSEGQRPPSAVIR